MVQARSKSLQRSENLALGFALLLAVALSSHVDDDAVPTLPPEQ
jgi:hypothetical protein